MNKLKTDQDGGQFDDLDDVRWQENGILEAFKGLASAIGDNFIISGVIIAGQNYTDGFICLNGEILPVVAAVAPTPGIGEINYWDLDISYDSTGTEAFENGTSGETYEIRKGKVVAGPAPGGTFMPFVAPTTQDLLGDNLFGDPSTEYDMVAGDVDTGGNHTFIAGKIRIKKLGKFRLLFINLTMDFTGVVNIVNIDLTSVGLGVFLSPVTEFYPCVVAQAGVVDARVSFTQNVGSPLRPQLSFFSGGGFNWPVANGYLFSFKNWVETAS